MRMYLCCCTKRKRVQGGIYEVYVHEQGVAAGGCWWLARYQVQTVTSHGSKSHIHETTDHAPLPGLIFSPFSLYFLHRIIIYHSYSIISSESMSGSRCFYTTT